MLPDVSVSAEAALRALGFRIHARNGDTWELSLPNSRNAVRTLRGDRGRITLSEARKRGDRTAVSRTLLVASGASPGVLDAARLGRWDILTWAPPRAVINGITYEAVGTDTPNDAPRRRDRAVTPDGDGRAGAGHAPSGTRHGGRLPWIRWGVARVLLVAGPQPVGALSERLGVSPQAVRRALSQLGDFVARDHHGEWSATSTKELERTWLASYPGALGKSTTWWHPLPPEGQARAVAVVAERLGARPLLAAGETGLVTAYVREDVDLRTELQRVGFAAIPAERATLRLASPKDPTLWATAQPVMVAGQAVLRADRLIAGLAG
ncbi:MAG: hypothetical protein ACTII7_09420 [Galactobacter sp.]